MRSEAENTDQFIPSVQLSALYPLSGSHSSPARCPHQGEPCASLGSLMTEMPSPEEAFVSLCCCSVGQSCLTLLTPWTVAHQAPGSSAHRDSPARIPEWVAMPSSRVLPNPGIESRSPALQEGFFFFFISWATWKVREPWVIPTEAERGRLESNQKTVGPGLPDEKDAKKGAASKVRCGHSGVISV